MTQTNYCNQIRGNTIFSANRVAALRSFGTQQLELLGTGYRSGFRDGIEEVIRCREADDCARFEKMAKSRTSSIIGLVDAVS